MGYERKVGSKCVWGIQRAFHVEKDSLGKFLGPFSSSGAGTHMSLTEDKQGEDGKDLHIGSLTSPTSISKEW